MILIRSIPGKPILDFGKLKGKCRYRLGHMGRQGRRGPQYATTGPGNFDGPGMKVDSFLQTQPLQIGFAAAIFTVTQDRRTDDPC